MCSLKRNGSTDSLSSWAPSVRVKTEYALRKMAETNNDATGSTVFMKKKKPNKAIRLKSKNTLQAKNDRLEPKSNIRYHFKTKNQKTYEKHIIENFEQLSKQTLALKEKSTKILQSGENDQEIDNDVQMHFKEIEQYFYNQLSQINSTDSNLSMKNKLFKLEDLKNALIQNIHEVDKWIDLLI